MENKCIGCESEELEKCEKTMCLNCWNNETEEPN